VTFNNLPFLATAVVLADANQCIAIIDVDTIGFDDEWTGKILDGVESLVEFLAIMFVCRPRTLTRVGIPFVCPPSAPGWTWC
jgi:hypothetical protein